MSKLSKTAAHAARFMTLAALLFINSALAVVCTAQRTDNRRLFWTGSNGSTWDNSTASWMTTGSFLAYAHGGTTSAVWLTTIPGTGDAVVADPAITPIVGDVVIFDSRADQGWIWNESAWSPPTPPYPDAPTPDPTATRVINIASEGVKVSDVVVSGPGSYVFTGGAITASPSFIAPGSVQVTGTGTGYAANYVRPTGALIKSNTGILTLSNTATNHFPGGIHLRYGTLSITDNHAIGDSNIILQYINTIGTTLNQSHIYGDILLAQIHRPGMLETGNAVPVIVVDSSGQLQRATVSTASLHVAASAAGLDITGDIYIGNRTNFSFNIEGETTISGRILGGMNNYGASSGRIIKTGTGTLILSGSQNWFYANGGTTSQVDEGRLVATNQYALGMGPFSIDPSAILEFRGAVGAFRQAFVGKGQIEITEGSDVTFNWRDGTLDGFDSVPSVAPANNDISKITISGTSRFSAIASGTYTTVLGGAGAQVYVTDRSTLAIGREGLSSRGTGGTKIPMAYAVVANRIDLSGGSTLVLNPNAFLSTGAFIVSDDSICNIRFNTSGVSRLRWQEGIDPGTIATDPNATTIGPNNDPVYLRYIVPAGMELIINDIPVPVNPAESVPADASSAGWCREYVLVNHGASPLIDIAQTFNAISFAHDTISTRLAEDFIDPVTLITPSRGRKWTSSAWMRYMHSEVDYDAGNTYTPGISGKVTGAVIGMNNTLPKRVFLGAYIGIVDNNLNTTNDVTFFSKQKFIGIHAAQKLGKFYIAIDAATGRVGTDSIRNEAESQMRAKWDTSYYSGDLQIGALFKPWQQTTIKPYAGLRYTKLKLSSYSEEGVSSFVIDDFSDSFSQAIYGVTASQKLVLFKRDLAASLSIGRKQTVSAPRSTLEGIHFANSPDTKFELIRGDYYPGFTTFGLSARMAVSTYTLVGIAAEYETASSASRLTGSILLAYNW